MGKSLPIPLEELPEDVLVHTFSFLTTKEVFAASCLSRDWNARMAEENCDFWKKIFSALHPAVARELLGSENVDYHRMTLRLWVGISPTIATLRVDQVFAVVELVHTFRIDDESRSEVVGEWTCPIAAVVEHEHDGHQQVILRLARKAIGGSENSIH